MSKSLTTPFWKWSNWKHIGTGTHAETRRAIIELRMKLEEERLLYSRLNYGHGSLTPNEIPLVDADLQFTGQPDDCPWPVTQMFPVSDRVRRILERTAPGNCQFVPMKLWHNGEPCDLVYWVLYVDSIDCADQEKSERNSMGSICDPVIIEEQVPPTIHIFRVWDDPMKNFSDASIFVRDGLRHILEQERVTGCFFCESSKPLLPPALYESAVQHLKVLHAKFGFDFSDPRLNYILAQTEISPAAGRQDKHEKIFLRLTAALEKADKRGKEADRVFHAELKRIHDDMLLNADQWLRP